MLSDAIFDALHSIEQYQTEFPDAYAGVADHIELVKSVMASLMNRLDDPFGDEQPHLEKLLSEDQKHVWRVTCEANIARWAERLRLLGPVSAEELNSKLTDAIARQETMLSQMRPDCGLGVPAGRNESVDEHQLEGNGSIDGLRPRRCTQSELAKVGVELLDERGLQLRCCNCGQIWSPNILAGGRMPRGYWKCPRGLGCN